jgi:hypothetical protein
MIVTNQNYIQKEIKGILNSGNACYHSVQNMSSLLVSKNFDIKIYKIILLLFCMDVKLGLSQQGKNIN